MKPNLPSRASANHEVKIMTGQWYICPITLRRVAIFTIFFSFRILDEVHQASQNEQRGVSAHATAICTRQCLADLRSGEYLPSVRTASFQNPQLHRADPVSADSADIVTEI